jgi:uncharacterized membrane protein (GlpM family)
MKTQDFISIAVSIVIIIAVAILQKQSKTIAAIVSTTPIRATLAIWVVYTAVEGSKTEMVKFNESVALSLIPTFFFAVSAWLAARAGFKLSGQLIIGYGVWAIGSLILYTFRRALGIA